MTWPTSRRCANSPTKWQRPRRLDQQRRDHGRARGSDGRRLRAAVRHQSSRSIRADQPAPAADHRSSGDRLVRRPRHGALDLDDLNWHRRRYQPWRPTGRPSSPTCSSPSSWNAGWRPTTRPCGRTRRIRAMPLPTCKGGHGNRIGDRLVKVANKVDRAERGDGRLADLVRGHTGTAWRQLRRSGPPATGGGATRPWSAAAPRPATLIWPRGSGPRRRSSPA